LQPLFQPLFRNPHLLTIAGNFWPRRIDQRRFPGTRKVYQIDRKTTIVAVEHQPSGKSRGQILFLHGLEGSADAGYIASCAQEALTRGFGVHRLNLRTCGGTEDLCETTYHSGLTSDTREISERIRTLVKAPIFLIGFSLGGNVALKLAGELGETDLLTGVVAVSTPLDLAACVRTLDRRSNRIYARRFLNRLHTRVRAKNKLSPHLYNVGGLRNVRTIWQFDDQFTAPLFGFGSAAHYYATQSSANFLDNIHIPSLVIIAKDDPLVPFEVYRHSAFQSNPALELLVTEHGGHVGFLSSRRPRFWIDQVSLDWISQLAARPRTRGTTNEKSTSA
jgi:predicted alpha/beta-fold hydrolase